MDRYAAVEAISLSIAETNVLGRDPFLSNCSTIYLSMCAVG